MGAVTALSSRPVAPINKQNSAEFSVDKRSGSWSHGSVTLPLAKALSN